MSTSVRGCWSVEHRELHLVLSGDHFRHVVNITVMRQTDTIDQLSVFTTRDQVDVMFSRRVQHLW